MFHLEMFSSSIPTGANTFGQLTFVSADAIAPQLNNGMQVLADLPWLMGVGGVSTNLVHIRPQSNSMLPFPYPALSPNNRGSSFESPPRWWDFSRNPIPLRPTEEFDIFATQNAAGAQTPYVACLFSNGVIDPIPVPILPPGIQINPATPGHLFTAHATASATLGAGVWTAVQPTFDQALYAGYYALLGARVYSATGLFFRMYPAMGPKWRPGGVCVNAYDQLDPVGQRLLTYLPSDTMGWGSWLTFYQNVPPKVEVFATAADSAEEFWFDLLYLGSQIITATP